MRDDDTIRRAMVLLGKKDKWKTYLAIKLMATLFYKLIRGDRKETKKEDRSYIILCLSFFLSVVLWHPTSTALQKLA